MSARFATTFIQSTSGEALVDIEPGTTWDEIGEAFQCPHCQAKKKLFIEVLS